MLKYDSQNKEAIMKRCTKCFEMREMFHGRCCKECRQKYLHFMQRERSKKKCPICANEHHGNCLECSTKCKILNRYKVIDECWQWQGKINESGYGALNIREEGIKTDVLVHREIFKIFKGEIPEGMLVCHTCDNPSCCNPEHLWLGTPKDNTQDMLKKNRGRHRLLTSEKRAHAAGKITEDQVREIRELYKNGSSQKELQEKFKLSQSQISGIITYRFWKHVT
jgi:hypothetical protein